MNKNIKIILKLPQWYEIFHKAGYDLNRLLPLFDEIAVGTETRDFKCQNYLPVHGALLFKYISELAKEKVKKAWFDIYLCDEKIFSEQCYQSLLGGANEIILFCAGILPQKLNRKIVENLLNNSEKFDRLTSFSKIFTIPILRKANTEGDYKLAQYFLMLGIPIYLTDKIDKKQKIILLTAQSGFKNEYLKIFNNLLNLKKTIFMTINFAKELKKYFNLKIFNNPIKISTISYKNKEYEIHDNIFINHEITNGKSIATFNNAYNFINVFKIKESFIYVVNFPFTSDTIETPEGKKESADFRYLLHNKVFSDIFKDIFTGYANLNLYEKIKTFYRYEI